MLEAFGEQDFMHTSLRSREQLMHKIAKTSSAAAIGLEALTTLTLFLFYGLADERVGIRTGKRSAIRAQSVRHRTGRGRCDRTRRMGTRHFTPCIRHRFWCRGQCDGSGVV